MTSRRPDPVGIGAEPVPCSDSEEGIRFKAAPVKSFAGVEPALISRMREEFVEIEPVLRLRVRNPEGEAAEG